MQKLEFLQGTPEAHRFKIQLYSKFFIEKTLCVTSGLKKKFKICSAASSVLLNKKDRIQIIPYDKNEMREFAINYEMEKIVKFLFLNELIRPKIHSIS